MPKRCYKNTKLTMDCDVEGLGVLQAPMVKSAGYCTMNCLVHPKGKFIALRFCSGNALCIFSLAIDTYKYSSGGW